MLIKNQLAELVKQSIQNAQAAGALPMFDLPEVFIERPQKKIPALEFRAEKQEP